MLSIHPILFLLAENTGEAFFNQTIRAFLVLPLGTLLVCLACCLISRNFRIASLYTTLTFTYIFSFGVVYRFANGSELNWLEGSITRAGLAMFVQVVMVILAFMLIRRFVKDGREITRVMNLVVGLLLLISLCKIVNYVYFDAGRIIGSPLQERHLAGSQEPTFTLTAPDGAMPDIYYIVLDGYTRADTLAEFYGFDNSDFIDFLTAEGFYITHKSRTNYVSTMLVIPSVLNFKYLDSLAEEVGRKSKDVTPLYELIYYNRVVPMLKKLGYHIVNITSGIDYVVIANADERIKLVESTWLPNKFEKVLLELTPTAAIQYLLSIIKSFASHRKRVEYSIDQLRQQSSKPGPKFVFAHIFSPHDPFVFGPNNEHRPTQLNLFTKYSKERIKHFRKAYGEQIAYLNGEIRKTVEQILSNSITPPIIILQGDHGLRLSIRRRHEDSCLKDIFTNFNALYLPNLSAENDADKKINASMSPVNTFRLVFDTYFGSELGFLEDRSYFSHRFGIFDFVDVTELVDTCAPQWVDTFAEPLD